MKHYKHAVNSLKKHNPSYRAGLKSVECGFDDAAYALRLMLEDLAQADGPELLAHYGVEAYLNMRESLESRCYGNYLRAKQYAVERGDVGERRGEWYNGFMLLRLYHSSKGYCVYCSRHLDIDDPDLAFDHKVALKRGGDDSISNLAVSCRNCNSSKGTKELKDVDLPQLGWHTASAE